MHWLSRRVVNLNFKSLPVAPEQLPERSWLELGSHIRKGRVESEVQPNRAAQSDDPNDIDRIASNLDGGAARLRDNVLHRRNRFVADAMQFRLLAP